MRLGGCLAEKYKNVDEWLRVVLDIGYKAVVFPLDYNADRSEIKEYVEAMRENDIENAEVGAWSNLISLDESERKAAMRKNIMALELAEETGARCCVNIAGSRGKTWDGPSKQNLTRDTFDMIVRNTQAIIDAVKPDKTTYTIETMPWVFPDSPEGYLRLYEAIDRKAFGIHLDVCNMINSPKRYFWITEYINHSFGLLGNMTRSIHLKDIMLSNKMTIHIQEVMPGEGEMDFSRIFYHTSKLDRDLPLIIEHLSTNEDYKKAYQHLRGVAEGAGYGEFLV